jgi:hypothetical protein
MLIVLEERVRLCIELVSIRGGEEMNTIVKGKKVSDMTVGELKELIKDTIYELVDPDYGLKLRTDVEESLKESMKQKERGEGILLDEAKKRLGLE